MVKDGALRFSVADFEFYIYAFGQKKIVLR